MEMPKVTDLHRKLYALTGDWEGTETMAESPWGPAGTAIGKLHIRTDMNGFFVLQDYIQEKERKVTFSGHGIFGYDLEAGNYTWYWVDSMGFVPDSPARGKFEGDTLKLEKVTPRGSARYAHRLEGKNSYHFTIENSFDQGKSWQTFLTAAYRRK
jgi:uncharacterized protein DUF1579